MEVNASELNTDVLEQIFKWFDSLTTLQAARLVCKNWYTSSASIWSFYRTFTLLQNDGAARDLNDHKLCLSDFKEIHRAQGEDEDAVPYRRFVLDGWIITDTQFTTGVESDDVSPNDDACEEIINLSRWFWKENGVLLTSISFQNCSFPINATVFKESFLTSVPNLTRLSLISCEFGDFACEEMKTCRFASYGYQHTNLRTLTICHVKAEYLNGAVHMFVSMLPNLVKIVALDLDWSIPPFTFTKIKSLDILGLNQSAIDSFPIGPSKTAGSLEDFQLDIGFNNDKRDLVRLIERHAKSLKRLHLYRAPFSEPFRDFSLHLDQLSELRLSGNVVNSLNFLSNLPSIKILEIHTASRSKNLESHLQQGKKRYPLFNTDFIENTSEDLTFQTIQKLNLDCGPFSVQSWLRLVNLMPNVQDLAAVITASSVLQVIGQHWSSLHCLEFNHGSMIDQGLEKLKHLRKFIWRGCNCNTNVDLDTQVKLERELSRVVGWAGHVILPWRECFSDICVDAEFRKMLTLE